MGICAETNAQSNNDEKEGKKERKEKKRKERKGKKRRKGKEREKEFMLIFFLSFLLSFCYGCFCCSLVMQCTYILGDLCVFEILHFLVYLSCRSSVLCHDVVLCLSDCCGEVLCGEPRQRPLHPAEGGEGGRTPRHTALRWTHGVRHTWWRLVDA